MGPRKRTTATRRKADVIAKHAAQNSEQAGTSPPPPTPQPQSVATSPNESQTTPPRNTKARSRPEKIEVSSKDIELSVSALQLRPTIRPAIAFALILSVRLLSSFFATIPDCDEVFNYWEPAHYLAHGSGFQTWEYSPEYAIRSWLYVGLHAILARLFTLVPGTPKTAEFYGMRILFALLCTFCETRLYTTISENLSRQIGLIYVFGSILSAGMFHATATFLPSTFAMYTTMLGMADFIDRKEGLKTARVVFWFALGGLLGWPFALVLIVPFMLEELVLVTIRRNVTNFILRILKGAFAALALLATIVAVDSIAYRKFEVVPLNIVLYNVFSAPGRGPTIYGTEPWWFYFANLALNFNILLPLALFSLVLAPASFSLLQTPLLTPRILTLISPFFIWISIFSSTPHKEERFMYPAYPLLIFNASVSLYILASLIISLSKPLYTRTARHLGRAMCVLPLIVTAILSFSRVMAILQAYDAPMHVYTGFDEGAQGNVCIGKEWYRFPSSYFLPEGTSGQFIKSHFRGLVPGKFPEDTDLGWRAGTWLVPEGMNDRNLPDPNKYIPIQNCTYLVDSFFPKHIPSMVEQPFLLFEKTWQKLKCKRFLDAQGTGFLGRTLWVPEILAQFGLGGEREWGEYCLMKRIPK